MSDIEGQIKSLKKELKDWEYAFSEKQGRKPTKKDIAQEEEIGSKFYSIINLLAKKYKVYNKLRSQSEASNAPTSGTETEEDESVKPQASAVNAKNLTPSQQPSRRPSPLQKEMQEESIVATPKQQMPKFAVERQKQPASISFPIADVASSSMESSFKPSAIPDLSKEELVSRPMSPAVVSFAGFHSLNNAGASPHSSTPKLGTSSRLTADFLKDDVIIASSIPRSADSPSQSRRAPVTTGQWKETQREFVGIYGQNTSQTKSQQVTQDDNSLKKRKDELDLLMKITTGKSEAVKGQQGSTKTVSSMVETKSVSEPVKAQETDPSRFRNKPVVLDESPPIPTFLLDDIPQPVEDTIIGRGRKGWLEDTATAKITATSTTNTSNAPALSPKVEKPAPQPQVEPQTVEQVKEKEKEPEKEKPTEEQTEQPKTEKEIEITPETTSSIPVGPGNAALKDVTDVFRRIPKNSVLQCKIYRKKGTIDKAHPTFTVINEADDKFLMSARKRKKSTVPNYIITNSPDNPTKDPDVFLGRLKGNFMGTTFIFSDARSYTKSSENKGLYDRSAIIYSKKALPREMMIAIPALRFDDTVSEKVSEDILADVKAKNQRNLLLLQNKSPKWNHVTGSHCLNFGGRVTMASIKNFQIIHETNDNYIMVQFGRVADDVFNLDVHYPMTPIEAFAICLTTFDAYDTAG